jgi:hypothetical protein
LSEIILDNTLKKYYGVLSFADYNMIIQVSSN